MMFIFALISTEAVVFLVVIDLVASIDFLYNFSRSNVCTKAFFNCNSCVCGAGTFFAKAVLAPPVGYPPTEKALLVKAGRINKQCNCNRRGVSCAGYAMSTPSVFSMFIGT